MCSPRIATSVTDFKMHQSVPSMNLTDSKSSLVCSSRNLLDSLTLPLIVQVDSAAPLATVDETATGGPKQAATL